MASLKGLALGLTAIIAVGYIATRTKAAAGISGLASAVTRAVAAPFAGLGEGFETLGAGFSTLMSPTMAPTFAPVFDWSQWKPFGNGNGAINGNGNGVRDEDRNGNGNGLITVSDKPPRTWEPYKPRNEDRNNGSTKKLELTML